MLRREEAAGGARGGGGRLLLELYTCGRLRVCTALDKALCGDPLADGWFAAAGDGGVAWTSDGAFAAFVAEAPSLAFPAPLFDAVQGKAAAAAGAGVGAALAGRQNEWSLEGGGAPPGSVRETWGERYDAVRSPRVLLVRIATGSVRALPGVAAEDAVSLGQASWAPPPPLPEAAACPRLLAYTAWPHGPRRLGIVYCYNRPSVVGMVDLAAWTAAWEAEEDSEARRDEQRHEHSSVRAPEHLAAVFKRRHFPSPPAAPYGTTTTLAGAPPPRSVTAYAPGRTTKACAATSHREKSRAVRASVTRAAYAPATVGE